MSLSTDLIDKLKKQEGIRSDNQIAKYLKITATTIYNYRQGGTMSYEIAEKVCEALEIDSAPVLAELTADRETDRHMKATWKKIAKRLSSTAAALLFATVLPFPGDNPTAQTMQANNHTKCVYYVK